VAASRARYEVRLFSSLRPEHIDLNRTKAQGVKDLKAYLDFALNGVRALATQATPTGREPDSPFEVAVIQTLRQHGWEVHPQVGVSGYRIDIGVVNPHEKGRYLLGVECDGATYHSASTARDRDRLRQMVLEGLGWDMHRIWSTDWWINPEIPMKKLLERLSQLEALVTGKK
jgi:very-short-patch-repair endonuclease